MMSSISLPHKVVLEGYGFEWEVIFEEIKSSELVFGRMTLKMRTVQQDQLIGSVLFSSFYKDLMCMAEYFKNHITHLMQDRNYESQVFVQYGLEFQVQALCGIVESEQDGQFAMIVMLNTGNASDESRVYVGVKSQIDVVKCRFFITKLQEFLHEWSESNHYR